MKNFRKVLALVLVVATLFSFTAMTSAAYEDADKISYDKAVDILSAVGVLNGYEVATDKYEFHPTDKITREEMAKMIAVMCNAGDDISTLYASACNFADVAKTRWSASYVAYCAKTGIVAGRSATTFDPTANVTGLETAKMLLVALGFDAEVQGYVGADWKINVLRDAKAMNLLAGFAAGYDIDVAITREEAAQMMLNALMGNVVIGYLSDAAKVVVTNKAYGSFNDKNWTLIDSNKDAVLYGKVVISNDALYTALYGGKLVKTASTRDCYGRPAEKWEIIDAKGKKTPVGTYPAAPIFTSSNTTAKEVFTKIEAYKGTEAATNIFYFEDGKQSAVEKTTPVANFGGKGVAVELYKVGTEFTIVEINTYVGRITEVNTLKNEITVNGRNIKNVNGYTLKDEGTLVMYWLCGTTADDLHAVETADVKTLSVHGYWADVAKFCDTNEKEYELAIDAEGTPVVGADMYYVLDKFGYVKFLSAVEDEINYTILVAKSAKKTINSVNNYGGEDAVFQAKFVEFEANPAVSELTGIDSVMFTADVFGTSNVVTNHDRLVAYTIDSKGNRAYVSEATAGINYAVKADSSKDLVLKKGTYAVENLAGNVAATSNTEYILRVYNYMTGKYEYKYFDGKAAIDGDYILTNMMYTTTNANYSDPALWLDLVYAEAKYVKASTMAFVTGKYSTESYITEAGKVVNCVLYKGYVNGEEALVAFEGEQAANYNCIWTADYQMIVAASHNQLPIYMASTQATAAMGSNFYVEGDTMTFQHEGSVKFTDLEAGAKVIVITVKEEKMTVAAKTPADLATYISAHGWQQVYGWYGDTNNNSVVDTVYVYVSDVAAQ